jgi:hypothetical protein
LKTKKRCPFRWTEGELNVACEREEGHSGPHVFNPNTGTIFCCDTFICCDTFRMHPPGGKLSPDKYHRLDKVVLEGLRAKLEKRR